MVYTLTHVCARSLIRVDTKLEQFLQFQKGDAPKFRAPYEFLTNGAVTLCPFALFYN